MTRMPGTFNRKAVFALAVWVVASAAGPSIGSQAQAGPLKRVMGQMNETTKAAKAELTAFNPGSAATLLQAYAQESRDAAGRSTDATSKAQDLHDRFVRLASTAESGVATATSQPQFRKVFVDIAMQCRSCHSVYK